VEKRNRVFDQGRKEAEGRSNQQQGLVTHVERHFLTTPMTLVVNKEKRISSTANVMMDERES
jgi:hypothetical protein